MHVVGHQGVRAPLSSQMVSRMQVPHGVGLCGEARAALVVTLNDVLGDIRQIEARRAWRARGSVAADRLALNRQQVAGYWRTPAESARGIRL